MGWIIGTVAASSLALIMLIVAIAAASSGGDSAQLEADLSRAESALIPQEEVERRNSDLDAREEALALREADVSAREAAISEVEAMVARNRFGDGIQIVGKTVEAGVYRTDDPGFCTWYLYRSGSNYEDVINSGFSNEPEEVTVVLEAGQDFDSSGCGTWTKVG
ncbi:hypothetical protein [Microbacterium sp. 2FI]|uniref:hypothetical protein n=1 Tax=Microbacterium sp. 2FI TaxID=2502193 RepID=UPI0020179C23|nr:hypothetical protein [Microbacterium sp. 2FI]